MERDAELLQRLSWTATALAQAAPIVMPSKVEDGGMLRIDPLKKLADVIDEMSRQIRHYVEDRQKKESNDPIVFPDGELR